MAAGLLLDKDLLQSTPSLCGIVLVYLDVNSLVGRNVEHKLASCSVLLDVPSSLLWACSGRVRLLAIHKSPEAFGAKEGLHFLTPGDVVRAIERLDAMGVLLVFGGHGGVQDMGRKMKGERSGEK